MLIGAALAVKAPLHIGMIVLRIVAFAKRIFAIASALLALVFCGTIGCRGVAAADTHPIEG